MPPTLTDSDRAAYNAAAAKVETKKAEIARIEGEEKEWIEQVGCVLLFVANLSLTNLELAARANSQGLDVHPR